MKKFHEYLFGNKFFLYTDHKPLVAIFGEKRGIPQLAASRLQRWSIILSAYQYEIKYINSVKNCVADALSRLHQSRSSNIKNDFGHILYVEEALPINYKLIATETQRDPILNRVYFYCYTGWPQNIHMISEELKPYYYRREQLHLEHGCILWGVRIVVPPRFREAILNEIHSSHLGMNKCKSIARSYCYWPSIDRDIVKLCQNCQICNKYSVNPPKAILHPWPQTFKPWSRIHIDFLGPIYNNKYIVIIDSYTKWLEVFKMQQTHAKHVINCLRSLFARYGLPDTLVSDNGPPFFSTEFEEYMQKNGIKHLFSPPYHAQSNGAAENCVKLVKNALKKAFDERKDLDEALEVFLFNYRISEHCSTKSSPANLLFGRNLKTRLDLLRPSYSNIIRDKQQKQIDNFSGIEKSFDIGNTVYAKVTDPAGSTWVPGSVVSKTGNVSYDVKVGNDKVLKRHSNQLKSRSSLSFPIVNTDVPNKSETSDVSPKKVIEDNKVTTSVDTSLNTETKSDLACSENNVEINSDRYNLRSRKK